MATRYVSATGTDDGDCTDPTKPCRTLAFAADCSNPGDTIRVGPGRHVVPASIPFGLSIIGGWEAPKPEDR